MQDDKNRGMQIGRQTAKDFLQRLNTPCRRSNND
jgi:hypothetical protein